MSFHLPFGNLSDPGTLSFINEHEIQLFLQYSHKLFQPLMSSDDLDEFCNPDSQLNTNNDEYTCDYFDHDNENLEKNLDGNKLMLNPGFFKY